MAPTLTKATPPEKQVVFDPNDRTRVVSVVEGAARCGVSQSTFKSLIRTGAIRSLKVARRRLVTIDAIASYLAAREAEASLGE